MLPGPVSDDHLHLPSPSSRPEGAPRNRQQTRSLLTLSPSPRSPRWPWRLRAGSLLPIGPVSKRRPGGGLHGHGSRGLLTSAFIHAPGLGPDFKRIRLFLPGAVGLLRGGGLCGRELGEHLGAVAGRGRVQAAVAGHAVLGAALAVLSLQRLLKGSEGEGRDGRVIIGAEWVSPTGLSLFGTSVHTHPQTYQQYFGSHLPPANAECRKTPEGWAERGGGPGVHT